MIILGILWAVTSAVEIGLMLWVNQRNKELQMKRKLYTFIVAGANLLLIVLAWYREQNTGISHIWFFGLYSYLLCMMLYDLKYKELPDWHHLVLLGFYSVLWITQNQPISLWESGITAIVLGAVLGLIIVIRREALGMGDLKLLIACGIYAGAACGGMVLRAAVAAFFYSILLLVLKKVTTKSELPFVPFLFLGALAI